MLRDLILESMEEARKTKGTKSKKAKATSKAEKYVVSMEKLPTAAYKSLMDTLNNSNLQFQSPADYYDEDKVKEAARQIIDALIEKFKKDNKNDANIETLSNRLSTVFNTVIDSKLTHIPLSKVEPSIASNIFSDYDTTANAEAPTLNDEGGELSIDALPSVGNLANEKWMKIRKQDFEILTSTVPNYTSYFDVVRITGGAKNNSLELTESFAHNFKKLLLEKTSDDFYLKFKDDVVNDLGAQLSKYDDFNNDDGKLQSSDIEAIINLHPNDEVRNGVADIFKTLKALGVIKDDSSYTPEEIPRELFYEKASQYLQSDSVGSDKALASWYVKKSILNPPDESNDAHKSFINLLMKKISPDDLKKIYSENPQKLTYKYGSPNQQFDEALPYISSQRAWLDAESHTAENPSLLFNFIDNDKFNNVSEFRTWLTKDYRGKTLEHLDADAVNKKVNGFFRAYMQVKEVVGDPNYKKLFNLMRQQFFIAGFEEILKDTDVDPEIVNICVQFLHTPEQRKQLQGNPFNKMLSEAVDAGRTRAQKYLGLYSRSAWQSTNDASLKLLHSAQRANFSRSTVGQTQTTPTAGSKGDVFSRDFSPSAGKDAAATRFDTTTFDTTAATAASSDNSFGEYVHGEVKEFSKIQTKLNDTLVKIADNTINKFPVGQKLALIRDFADYVKNPSANHAFIDTSKELELKPADIFSLTYLCSLLFDASKKSESGNTGNSFEGMLTLMLVAPSTGRMQIPGQSKRVSAPVDNVLKVNNTKTIVYTSAKAVQAPTQATQNKTTTDNTLATGMQIIYFTFSPQKGEKKSGARADDYDKFNLYLTMIYQDSDGVNKKAHLNQYFEPIEGETINLPILDRDSSKYVVGPRKTDDKFVGFQFFASSTPTGLFSTRAIETFTSALSQRTTNNDQIMAKVGEMLKASQETTKHLEKIKSVSGDLTAASSSPSNLATAIGSIANSLAQMESANLAAFSLQRNASGGYSYLPTGGNTFMQKVDEQKITSKMLKKLFKETLKK